MPPGLFVEILVLPSWIATRKKGLSTAEKRVSGRVPNHDDDDRASSINVLVCSKPRVFFYRTLPATLFFFHQSGGVTSLLASGKCIAGQGTGAKSIEQYCPNQTSSSGEHRYHPQRYCLYSLLLLSPRDTRPFATMVSISSVSFTSGH